MRSTKKIERHDPPQKPVVIALLSLLLLGGVGQIQLGQTRKGALIIIGTLLLLPFTLGFIVWLVGSLDAYLIAEKLKNGEAIGDMQWFWETSI